MTIDGSCRTRRDQRPVRRRRRIPVAAAAVVAFCVSAAMACFWDSDTLRQEARGLPGMAEVLVGAFERFPPEYYERRIEIARERLSDGRTPLSVRLEAFDNIAVSSDRLGDADGALAALAEKRALLDSLAAEGTPETEHEYRYHANRGTVLAHRWLRDGADRSDLGDLEGASREIDAALRINPEAHFGRERYQLAIIDWLRSPGFPPPEDESGLFEALLAAGEDRAANSVGRAADAAEGLVGLVVLGNAWESVDVAAVLSKLLLWSWHGPHAVLANARGAELLDAGRVPLHAFAEREVRDGWANDAFGLRPPDIAAVRAWFTEARVAADAWQAEHDAWVRGQLARGLHPDLDEAAFGTFAPAALPPMPNGVAGLNSNELNHLTGAVFMLVLVVVLGVLVVVALVLGVRRLLSGRRKGVAGAHLGG